MNKLNNSKGSAILVALALILLVSGISIVTLDSSTTDMDLSYYELHEQQAFYLADAGAKRAFATTNQDSSWRSGWKDVSFGEGHYSVALRDSTADPALDDTVIVLSTALVDGTRSTVELTLIPDIFNPFAYAMFAENFLDIKTFFVTDSYNSDSGNYASTQVFDGGDLGSNGTISVNNLAQIGGDVSTSLLGGADVDLGATIAGTISDTAPEQDLPPIPDEEFTWAESVNAAETGMTGDYSYDVSTNAFRADGEVELTSGVYYFSDVILDNSASLKLASGANVTIYVAGNTEVKNSAAINAGGDPADCTIYSKGDIFLKNSGDIAATFYAPEGTVDLGNSGEFYGSIVAYDVICRNSANFHYDRKLAEIERKGFNNYNLVAWAEIL